MKQETKKQYRLRKEINHPLGSVKEGVKSIFKGGYYVFPYTGKEFDHNGNGWLGNGFMIQNPIDFPDFFEEVKPVEKEMEMTDSEKLKNLAMWFDCQDDATGNRNREVQADLRRIAEYLKKPPSNTAEDKPFVWTDELVKKYVCTVLSDTIQDIEYFKSNNSSNA